MTLAVGKAAIKYSNGIVCSAEPPVDCGEVLEKMVSVGAYRNDDWSAGFILSDGSFVSRARAAEVAFAAGQIKAPLAYLFMSDLT